MYKSLESSVMYFTLWKPLIIFRKTQPSFNADYCVLNSVYTIKIIDNSQHAYSIPSSNNNKIQENICQMYAGKQIRSWSHAPLVTSNNLQAKNFCHSTQKQHKEGKKEKRRNAAKLLSYTQTLHNYSYTTIVIKKENRIIFYSDESS